MNDSQQAPSGIEGRTDDDDISREELAYWSEFCAWTALLLVPLLWWFNGPSVSTDQLYVRSGLLVLSATTAIVLRAGKWWTARRTRRSEVDDARNKDTDESKS